MADNNSVITSSNIRAYLSKSLNITLAEVDIIIKNIDISVEVLCVYLNYIQMSDNNLKMNGVKRLGLVSILNTNDKAFIINPTNYKLSLTAKFNRILKQSIQNQITAKSKTFTPTITDVEIEKKLSELLSISSEQAKTVLSNIVNDKENLYNILLNALNNDTSTKFAAYDSLTKYKISHTRNNIFVVSPKGVKLSQKMIELCEPSTVKADVKIEIKQNSVVNDKEDKSENKKESVDDIDIVIAKAKEKNNVMFESLAKEFYDFIPSTYRRAQRQRQYIRYWAACVVTNDTNFKQSVESIYKSYTDIDEYYNNLYKEFNKKVKDKKQKKLGQELILEKYSDDTISSDSESESGKHTFKRYTNLKSSNFETFIKNLLKATAVVPTKYVIQQHAKPSTDYNDIIETVSEKIYYKEDIDIDDEDVDDEDDTQTSVNKQTVSRQKKDATEKSKAETNAVKKDELVTTQKQTEETKQNEQEYVPEELLKPVANLSDAKRFFSVNVDKLSTRFYLNSDKNIYSANLNNALALIIFENDKLFDPYISKIIEEKENKIPGMKDITLLRYFSSFSSYGIGFISVYLKDYKIDDKNITRQDIADLKNTFDYFMQQLFNVMKHTNKLNTVFKKYSYISIFEHEDNVMIDYASNNNGKLVDKKFHDTLCDMVKKNNEVCRNVEKNLRQILIAKGSDGKTAYVSMLEFIEHIYNNKKLQNLPHRTADNTYVASYEKLQKQLYVLNQYKQNGFTTTEFLQAIIDVINSPDFHENYKRFGYFSKNITNATTRGVVSSLKALIDILKLEGSDELSNEDYENLNNRIKEFVEESSRKLNVEFKKNKQADIISILIHILSSEFKRFYGNVGIKYNDISGYKDYQTRSVNKEKQTTERKKREKKEEERSHNFNNYVAVFKWSDTFIKYLNVYDLINKQHMDINDNTIFTNDYKTVVDFYKQFDDSLKDLNINYLIESIEHVSLYTYSSSKDSSLFIRAMINDEDEELLKHGDQYKYRAVYKLCIKFGLFLRGKSRAIYSGEIERVEDALKNFTSNYYVPQNSDNYSDEYTKFALQTKDCITQLNTYSELCDSITNYKDNIEDRVPAKLRNRVLKYIKNICEKIGINYLLIIDNDFNIKNGVDLTNPEMYRDNLKLAMENSKKTKAYYIRDIKNVLKYLEENCVITDDNLTKLIKKYNEQYEKCVTSISKVYEYKLSNDKTIKEKILLAPQKTMQQLYLLYHNIYGENVQIKQTKFFTTKSTIESTNKKINTKLNKLLSNDDVNTISKLNTYLKKFINFIKLLIEPYVKEVASIRRPHRSTKEIENLRERKAERWKQYLRKSVASTSLKVAFDKYMKRYESKFNKERKKHLRGINTRMREDAELAKLIRHGTRDKIRAEHFKYFRDLFNYYQMFYGSDDETNIMYDNILARYITKDNKNEPIQITSNAVQQRIRYAINYIEFANMCAKAFIAALSLKRGAHKDATKIYKAKISKLYGYNTSDTAPYLLSGKLISNTRLIISYNEKHENMFVDIYALPIYHNTHYNTRYFGGWSANDTADSSNVKLKDTNAWIKDANIANFTNGGNKLTLIDVWHDLEYKHWCISRDFNGELKSILANENTTTFNEYFAYTNARTRYEKGSNHHDAEKVYASTKDYLDFISGKSMLVVKFYNIGDEVKFTVEVADMSKINEYTEVEKNRITMHLQKKSESLTKSEKAKEKRASDKILKSILTERQLAKAAASFRRNKYYKQAMEIIALYIDDIRKGKTNQIKVGKLRLNTWLRKLVQKHPILRNMNMFDKYITGDSKTDDYILLFLHNYRVDLRRINKQAEITQTLESKLKEYYRTDRDLFDKSLSQIKKELQNYLINHIEILDDYNIGSFDIVSSMFDDNDELGEKAVRMDVDD